MSEDKPPVVENYLDWLEKGEYSSVPLPEELKQENFLDWFTPVLDKPCEDKASEGTEDADYSEMLDYTWLRYER